MVNKSSKVNKNYLKKGGQWEDTDKAHTVVEGTFEEFGDIPDDKIDAFERPSNQKHYGALYQYIADGLTDGEILAINPNYIPMIGKFQAIRNAINEKSFSYEHRDLEVYYIYGESRWKKVESIRKKYGDTNVYSVSDYDNPFDDYNSEDVIICVFKGEEIREPFHRQDFFFINYAYMNSYQALSAKYNNLITINENECYIGQPFSGYALRKEKDSEDSKEFSIERC